MRVFGAGHMMTDVVLTAGAGAAAVFPGLLADERTRYLQVPNSARGYYLERVEWA